MYMTEILLQMACGGAWELPAAPASGGSPSGGQSSAFQTLLEERQSQLSRPEQPQEDPREPVEAGPELPQRDEAQTPALSMNLMAMGAALLAEGFPRMQTPLPPETAAALPLVEGTVPEAAAGLEQMAQQLPAEAVQAAPVQTPETAAQQPSEVISPKGGPVQQSTALPETKVVSAAAEKGGTEALKDLPAAAAPRQKEPVETAETAGAWSTALFAETEHMPVKVGEAVTVDTTAPAQETESLLGKALLDAAQDGSQRLEIQLSPANLGSVTVEFIRSPEGALHVVLHAENGQAAHFLNDHAQALGLMLQDTVRGEVRVEVPQPQQGQQLWQQPDQGGQQQHQHQQHQQQTPPRQEAEAFLHQLRLGLLQTAPEAV